MPAAPHALVVRIVLDSPDIPLKRDLRFAQSSQSLPAVARGATGKGVTTCVPVRFVTFVLKLEELKGRTNGSDDVLRPDGTSVPRLHDANGQTSSSFPRGGKNAADCNRPIGHDARCWFSGSLIPWADARASAIPVAPLGISHPEAQTRGLVRSTGGHASGRILGPRDCLDLRSPTDEQDPTRQSASDRD